MRIVIAGGTGLVGRALAASLAGDRHQVIVLSRTPERVNGVHPGISVLGWDGRRVSRWATQLEGADAVVNLAGESLAAGRWTAARKACLLASRVAAGRAVTQAVQGAHARPRVLVQASGIGIYGPHRDELLDESYAPGDDFLGRLAVEWEASTAPVEGLGVRRVVVRSGVVLSREGGALPRLLAPFRYFAGGPLGSGRQWMAWVHIADEVRAIRYLIEHEAAQGPYNLCAPHPVTNAKFAAIVGRLLHRPSFLPAPALALRLLLGQMATVLLDGQRASSQELQKLGFEFRFPTAEEALRDLIK
jgi:uncharacterized protein